MLGQAIDTAGRATPAASFTSTEFATTPLSDHQRRPPRRTHVDNASPLQTMTQTTTTALERLSRPANRPVHRVGAVGADNPVIAVTCVKADLPLVGPDAGDRRAAPDRV
jgi:hypothetical protein